ncbi:MAG TPA: DUF2939 domain-containing protein [Phenylobacterium sp.]
MRLAFLALVGLLLSSCATVQRYDAAADVHALLISIRDNDREAFERHVDRTALKRQIEGRLVDETRKSGAPTVLQGLGIALAQPLSALAGEVLVQPRVFRGVAEYYGYRPTDPIPGSLVIGQALRPIGGGRVCAAAKSGGPCVLVFTLDDGVWRLSGFEGELSLLRIR